MTKPSMTTNENVNKGQVCEVLCIKCNVETEHQILYSFDVSGSEPVEAIDEYDRVYEISWNTSHQVIRCGGCKTVTFREEKWFSEDEGTTEFLYPIRSKGKLTAKDFL